MAASLFALLDDIATLLDDVAAMTKTAAGKTAGVLGDDLAVNAEQVSGVRADRELPVVWAVARGSLRNKAMLVPAALAISALLPQAITLLLMAGGVFLCFEGFEKLLHARRRRGADAAAAAPAETEAQKISGAIRTDLILSGEIIAITLGTVAEAPFVQQVAVLCGVAVLMTVGVYGTVAGIVKLDDLGLWLSRRPSALARALGRGLLRLAPRLMQGLSVAGVAAVFLVGGGILAHGWPAWHHGAEAVVGRLAEAAAAAGPTLAAVVSQVAGWLGDALLGLLAGGLAVAAWTAVQRLRGQPAAH